MLAVRVTAFGVRPSPFELVLTSEGRGREGTVCNSKAEVIHTVPQFCLRLVGEILRKRTVTMAILTSRKIKESKMGFWPLHC
jgi:hypothetical protein